MIQVTAAATTAEMEPQNNGTDLQQQRRALEERQAQLSRAIRTIKFAEESLKSDPAGHPARLKEIIEVLAMEDDIELMRKYFATDEEWDKQRQYYEQGPSEEWQALYRDVTAALNDDPASDRAQALANRWNDMVQQDARNDPAMQAGSPAAWQDRENWPLRLKKKLAILNLEAIFEFIARAGAASRKKYFSDSAWRALVQSGRDRFELDLSGWQDRVELCAAIEKASSIESPSSPAAQELASRWLHQVEIDSARDPAARSGLMKMWADRRSWPSVLKYQMQGLHMMPYERLVKCIDFIDEAIAAGEEGSKGRPDRGR
jgi:hypothetical protein